MHDAPERTSLLTANVNNEVPLRRSLQNARNYDDSLEWANGGRWVLVTYDVLTPILLSRHDVCLIALLPRVIYAPIITLIPILSRIANTWKFWFLGTKYRTISAKAEKRKKSEKREKGEKRKKETFNFWGNRFKRQTDRVSTSKRMENLS